MSRNFLEVDETKFHSKFLINNGLGAGPAGGADDQREEDEDDSEGLNPLSWLKPRPQPDSIPIFTPSQKKEASQCKFIIPKPGTCVKTKDTTSGKKFFINFCHSDDVPQPQLYYTDNELRHILSSGSENEVDDIRIPISIGEKNVVMDSGGSPCLGVDVIVNTTFYNSKFLTSEIYREFFIIVAIEGIEAKHKVALDRDTYKILRNKKSMGKLQPQFVRSKAGILEVNERGDSGTTVAGGGANPFPKQSPSSTTSSILLGETNGMDVDETGGKSLLEPVTTKRFVQEVIATKDSHLNCVVTQQSEELATAVVKIPNLLNPKKLAVTVGADRLIVESPVGSIDIFLPLDFHQEKCRAEYDPSTSILSLHLPLVAPYL